MKAGYNPLQLLRFAKINPFTDAISSSKKDDLVANILAIVLTEKDHLKLQERIGEEIVKFSDISIGQALEKLHAIATIGKEFNGGCDGLDVLIYHLSGHRCEQAICDLKNVLRRFEEEKLGCNS